MQLHVVFSVHVIAIAILLSSTQQQHVNAKIASYLDVIRCVGQLNYVCALDKSQDILQHEHQQLLVEADAKLAGRQMNSEETPSALIDSITDMFSKLSNFLFKHGFSGLFRDADASTEEGGDDDDENAEDDEIATEGGGTEISDEKKKKKMTKGRELREDASEGRGKKKRKTRKMKKHKIKVLIKMLLFAAVLYGKIMLLLKVLATHLQFKFLAIAGAGLLINIARFYLDLKGGHHPQKVIYYEHAQHQHHYDNEDDWGGSSNHGGYWGRSYENESKAATGANVAYYSHKPAAESSWFKLF